MRPWIGVTTYAEDAQWGSRAGRVSLLPVGYAESVNRAGGRAVLVPTDDPGTDVLDRLDGLILAGGPDVDPAHYGEPPHPTTASSIERDTAELLLLRGAVERDLPLLGICRGMQLMAVAAGGRLHQHLPDLLGHTGHRPPSDPGTVPSYGEHTVRLRAGTRLHEILGDEVRVNSLHHQGVADPGRLIPAGWCPADDLIEAAQWPDRAFALAVQWHPEDLPDGRLFAALVEAARDRVLRRTPLSPRR
jgi:putative glutamine amidotransferase